MALRHDFRNIDPREARIVLVEAGPRVLPAFPASAVSEAARRSLEKLGVEVRLGTPVTEIDDDGVIVGGERIEAATVIWGGRRRGLAGRRNWLGAENDRAGRVMVEPTSPCPAIPRSSCIGDTAHRHGRGRQAAARRRAGRQAAGRLCRAALLRAPARRHGRAAPFRYRDTATWRPSAARLPSPISAGCRLTGFARLAAVGPRPHLVPDRLPQPPDRRCSTGPGHYLTFQRGARLITGPRARTDSYSRLQNSAFQ